jgi:hypothetical protein
MNRLVRQCVTDYLKRMGRTDVDTDHMVYLDASNGLVDGCSCLFLRKEDGVPRLVAKAARTAAGKAIYQTEFNTLTKLHQTGLNAKIQRTPEPLGIWNSKGVLVTLQSALSGSLMKNIPGKILFSRQRFSHSIDLILIWWLHLHKTFGIRRIVVDSSAYEEKVLGPIKRFRCRFLLNPDEHRFLNDRYEKRRLLSGMELPLMIRHGDFWPANIVLGKDGIGVFDWEFPLEFQLPLFDLFFFFSSIRFPFTGVQRESTHFKSFVNIFWGENYCNHSMRKVLQKMSRILNISPKALPDLFLLLLVEIANMKYDGLLQSAGISDRLKQGDTLSDKEMRLRWQAFQQPDMDVPFACIEKGVSLNIRFVVEHGFPDFRNG